MPHIYISNIQVQRVGARAYTNKIEVKHGSYDNVTMHAIHMKNPNTPFLRIAKSYFKQTFNPPISLAFQTVTQLVNLH